MVSPGWIAAQTGPGLGVELGYSRANFTGADASGATHRDGALAGAWFRLPLSGGIAVQPGITLASRGGTVVVPSSLGTLRLEADLVYMDLPLLLRIRLPGPLDTRFVLLGGGAPSVRIGCNVEVQQPGVPVVRQTCAQTSGAAFRGWDVALVAGAGIAIPVERSELSLEVKLQRGLRSVTEGGEVRNQAYTVAVSVPF